MVDMINTHGRCCVCVHMHMFVYYVLGESYIAYLSLSYKLFRPIPDPVLGPPLILSFSDTLGKRESSGRGGEH